MLGSTEGGIKLDYLHVGRLVGTHGIRGEVRVLPDTDFPEYRFAPGKELWLVHPTLSHPLPLTVETCRSHRSVLLVKFEQWNNLSQVEPYRGGELIVDQRDAAPIDREKGEFYYDEIIGCEVATIDGNYLGSVVEIPSLPANDVWVIQLLDQPKKMYLPYIDEVVKEVDVEKKRIVIQWMEGLD